MNLVNSNLSSSKSSTILFCCTRSKLFLRKSVSLLSPVCVFLLFRFFVSIFFLIIILSSSSSYFIKTQMNPISPLSSRNCMVGITASDFSPAYTTTTSGFTSITLPVRIAPGFICRLARLSSSNCAKDSLIFVFALLH